MVATRVEGLAPYLPAGRPRAAARWWVARGVLDGATLRIESLSETERLPEVKGACGLAAPCSLPPAFLEHLGVKGERAQGLARLERWTVERLAREARAFAARAPRGRRHPARDPAESLSCLDRRRLPLLHAALPLLRRVRTRPWDEGKPPFLFEVDVASFLGALELDANGLAGSHGESVDRRVRILQALQEGVLGWRLDLRQRDYAVAGLPALSAVLAACAAAWLVRSAPAAPDAVPAAAAWIPLP